MKGWQGSDCIQSIPSVAQKLSAQVRDIALRAAKIGYIQVLFIPPIIYQQRLHNSNGQSGFLPDFPMQGIRRPLAALQPAARKPPGRAWVKNVLHQQNLPPIIENNADDSNGEAHNQPPIKAPQDVVQPGMTAHQARQSAAQLLAGSHSNHRSSTKQPPYRAAPRQL
jgi:hypothetical protein